VTTRVVIVQHGEKRREPGNPGLTAAGLAQARAVAAALVPAGAAGADRPVAVWSSPLRRAAETAAPIAARAGLDVRVDARLRERMNWDDPAAEPIEAFLADWRRASRDRGYVPRSGDSSFAAADRFLAALADAAGAAGDGTVVAVAHGGVTGDALRTLLGDGPLRDRAPALVEDGVPSCALTTLVRVGDGWAVEDVAATAHLGATADHRPA
jgi:broad specificity phosphatase PhoE